MEKQKEKYLERQMDLCLDSLKRSEIKMEIRRVKEMDFERRMARARARQMEKLRVI